MRRWQEVHQDRYIPEVGENLAPERLRHGWYGANRVYLDKTRIPDGFEVAIETGVGLRGSVDERIGKIDLEAIHTLQHQGVGIQDPDLLYQVRIDIGAATHTPVLGQQAARKCWCSIETAQIKGPQRCRMHL